MIDLQWLQDSLCRCLRWQFANPGRADGLAVPWAGKRIWSIFVDLSAARGSNGWGPNPIGFAEIDAWSRLNREPVRPWELAILKAMDTAYMESANQRADKGQQTASQRSSGAAISAKLFDAVIG